MSRLVFVLFSSLWVRVGGVPARPEPATPVAAPIVVTRAAGAGDLSPFLMLAAEATTKDAGLAELRRGLKSMRAGDAAGAVVAFERAAEILPGIADWAHVLGAEAAAAAGDVATVERLLGATEPVLARDWGWRARLTAAQQSGSAGSAKRVLTAAIDSLSDPLQRADAAKRLADLELGAGATVAGRAALRRVFTLAPGSIHAVDAARIASTLPGLTANDHLEIGRIYLRHGNRDRGIAGLDRYLQSGRGTPAERVAVRLEAARALFDARRYQEAERRLISLASETGDNSTSADALLLLGRTQLRRNRTTAARATLLGVADRFPGGSAAGEALYIVAGLDHDRGALASARALYRRAVRTWPESEAAGEAAMRLGGVEFAQHRYAEAAAVYEDYRTHHPQGRRFQQATYWAGRARAAGGERPAASTLFREAAALDPASYYGIRAAGQLDEAIWHSLLAPAPATGARNALETAGAFTRLEILDSLGLEREHAHEMLRLKRYLLGKPGGFYALAEGYHARGHTYTAILLGRELQRSEGRWNDRLLRIVYPFPYRESILEYARQRDIDPHLVAGLIRQESMFNPRARSSAGAIGLMQIMPPTGRGLARSEGTTFAVTRLREPAFNIRLGTRFMADLLRRYDGRLTYVLAAYNAGPSRVARWRNLPEAWDADLFAERIPFAETREYVKIVQQNAWIYRALYGD
jgi:soluble lytic murein transglycosylase